MDFRACATAELTSLVERLSVAADAAARAARDEAAATAQETIDALSAQRAEVEQALQEETAARQAFERANALLEREKEALRTAAERDKEALRSAAEREKEALRAALERETDTLRAAVDAARAEASDVRRDLQTKLDETRRTAAADSARAKEWRFEQGRMLRDHAVTFVSRSLDHLLASTTRFADAATENDVLATIVAALGTELSRVALFKVTNNRIELVRHIGFDFPENPTHLVIPNTIDAVLTRAVTSGQVEILSADALAGTEGTPFGGTAACGLALPIDLDGDACAVLYADDSDQPHQAFANVDLRRKFALLLRQLAAPLLARLPAEDKTMTEMREYAARLVTELENMYAVDVSGKKKGADLRRRLQDNVECARGIYAQRVSSEAPAAAALLDEQLALAITRTRATAFGRDLAAVVGTVEPLAAEA